MLRKIYFSVVVFILFGAAAFAQNNSGVIKVLLKDKSNGEGIPFANVVAYQNGVQVAVGTTDVDGYAVIKPLVPGKYDVKGVYVGYQPQEVKGIIVRDGATAYPTIELSNGEGVKLDEVEVVAWSEPLVDPDTKSGGTVTREEYQHMATKDVNSVAATTAGVYQADEGAALNVRGGRSNNTTYFVDGVKVIGGQGLPQQSVEQISVITGGLPAQYGDATSGVISITTRGPQSQFFGGVELISSQLTDKYGYNSLGFSVGGPIWQKKDTAGNKTPVIGFFLSGQGTYQKDPQPSYVKLYQVNDDVMKDIQDHPLTPSPAGTGQLLRKTDFVTKKDLYQSAVRPNVASRALTLNGKLDFRLSPSTNLTIGGALDYSNAHSFIYEYMLFNSENNPQVINTTWRTYARINQKFGAQGAAKEKAQSVVSNAYFTFLASYEQSHSKTQDDTHKKNFFDYGYIGKFHQKYDTGFSNYQLTVVSPDSVIYKYTGASQKGVTFERSDINAIAANYTSQVFDYLGGNVNSINDIQTNNGFVNGDRPPNTYGDNSFYSTGRQYNGYLITDQTQLRFTSSFSADIKNHAIMVGLEYDQRNQRGYSLSPIDLWTRMRQLATSAPLDTVGQYVGNYNGYNAYWFPYNNDATNSQFVKSLGEKLGLPSKTATPLNVNEYDPSFYSLDMFSANDLLNNGNGQLVDYYGYDYLGNKYNGATNLDDFLNKKDSRGNNLYPVGSYRPIYVAGYIQDKFDFKDIKFNVGLRVDRFDANQKVAKDQYVFHDTYTAGEISQAKPDNIGSDYVAYIAQNPANIDPNSGTAPTVIGYRNGRQWYNAEGKEVSDPTALNSGSTPYPWIKNAADAKTPFSASAFTDYKAQINFMPRVAFSFPISDVANFFAHYDVLTQRPSGIDMRFDPKDYQFLGAQSNNPFITNSNLKPERTVDYELGYNQVLNEKKNAALKVTAFYREMRNQVTIVRLNAAYPKTYSTYANQDFGTVKGMSFEFDLRRTGGFSLTANYTLQFADGSGSNANSGANLANSGQPNLRVTLPLDYDQRHNIVCNLDYRFGAGKDYRGPKMDKKRKDGTEKTIQFLQNVGANLILRVGSGTPYTRYTNPVAYGSRSNILGSLNGSNKPWQFKADLRVDKNIELAWGKKEGDSRKTANLNIYLQVLNLLNTKNILNVYNYTGNPDDDGYLNSPLGQSNVKANVSKQGFIDQYGIYINQPGNYSRPRTIRIGVLLDF